MLLLLRAGMGGTIIDRAAAVLCGRCALWRVTFVVACRGYGAGVGPLYMWSEAPVTLVKELLVPSPAASDSRSNSSSGDISRQRRTGRGRARSEASEADPEMSRRRCLHMRSERCTCGIRCFAQVMKNMQAVLEAGSSLANVS